MTDIWLDSAEYLGGDESAEWDDDAAEYVDFGDDYDDMFGDATKTASAKRREEEQRRTAAARRRALERRRRAQARRPRTPARPVTTTAAIKNTRAAVRSVDLENRVRADAFGGAVKALDRRTTGTERTASANALVGLLQAELDDIGLDPELAKILKEIVPFSALLFLKPPSRGYLRDPRIMAGLAGGAVLIGGALIRKFNDDDENPPEGLNAPGRAASWNDGQQVTPSIRRSDTTNHGSRPLGVAAERRRRS